MENQYQALLEKCVLANLSLVGRLASTPNSHQRIAQNVMTEYNQLDYLVGIDVTEVKQQMGRNIRLYFSTVLN